MDRVVIFLILFVYCLAACSAESQSKGEEDQPKAKAQTEHEAAYIPPDFDVFNLLRMVFAQHKDVVNNMVASFFFGMGKIEPPLRCPSRVQCSTGGSLREVLMEWDFLMNSVLSGSGLCKPCQHLFRMMNKIVCDMPWEGLRDSLISLCETTLPTFLNMDPVMCNGTVTLQGKHLYCLIQEVPLMEVCESLDMCYPEARKIQAVQKRTPWRMKERLERRLRREIRSQIRSKKDNERNDVIKVVQLTDIHIHPDYAIGAPAECKAIICCLNNSIPVPGTGHARKWGEYSCNLPERTMRKFLERVNDFNPDFVIYGGDSPPHTSWSETFDSQLHASNIVANSIRDILTPGTKVYPNIGNHEMFPTNLYSSRLLETREMNQASTDMWHDLAGFDAQANATFSSMSYYSLLHQPGLRILSINTNYDWYNMNVYNSLNKNDSSNAQHKTFVETTLANARANGEKVIIIGHHPVHNAIVRASRWWQNLAIKYSDVIVLHVSGHSHSDEFDLIIDPEDNMAKSVNLVSPTVTTYSKINPSMRVFELDSVTFELRDFQCYYFDINTQLPDQDPDIVLNYDARRDYNMRDLSPASWQQLALRFIDDETLFQKYYNHRHADSDCDGCISNAPCGERCKKEQICTIWFPVADELAACMKSE